MLNRILLILGLICLGLTGCLWDDPPPGYRGEIDTDIYIAPDIEASIRLSYANELRERPASILDIDALTKSGLEWRDVNADGLDIEFKLLGTKLGTHDLNIRYRDRDGHKRKQTFQIHVVEHHHSVARVYCDSSASGAPYFLPPGARFDVRVSGYDADDNPLPLGELDLLKDTDGFERDGGILNPWIAPDEPGKYTWTLAGKEERDLEIIVYDPKELLPTLSVPTRSTTERPQVVVGLGSKLQGDEGLACMSPANARVDLETIDGECLPAFGALQFEDGLSLDVSDGAKNSWISGKGKCTVRATTEWGGRAEVTLDADMVVSRFDVEDSTYRVLGDDTVEVVAAPEESIDASRPWAGCRRYSAYRASTECDSGYYLEAYERSGCFRKAGWTVSYADLDDDTDYAALGVGLTGEIDFRLDAKGGDSNVDGLDMQPTELSFSPSFESLVWDELGCTETKRVFQVTATAARNYELTLDALNATEKKDLTVRVHSIAQTTLGPSPSPEPPPNPGTELQGVRLHDGASTQHWFVDEFRTVELAYLDEAGEPLRGIGSIVVSSSDEDSDAAVLRSTDHRWFGIFVGARSNVVEVSSPHAPGVHRIIAEEADGIAGIAGLDVVRLNNDALYCVSIYPLAEDGLLISGKAPVPPRVRGTRGALVVSTSRDGLKPTCFRGHTPGDVELEWSWGDAEENVTWTVE